MEKNSIEEKRSLVKEIALFGNLKVLVVVALMVAISIVCGKFLAIPGGTVMRFSFENLPIIFTAIAFGPIMGATAGVAADIIGCLMATYEINPIVTLGAALIGIIAGVVYRLSKGLPQLWSALLSVVSAHLIGSVLVKTFGLAKYYSMDLGVLMAWRLLNYVIVGALEFLILYHLLKSKAINSQLKKIKQK